MRLTYEIEQETDGRWLAEIVELPGVMAYGETGDRALVAAQALAFRVIAERIEHGEHPRAVDRVEFVQVA
jgi:predicted RNase H-like HicB family nuclease